MIQDPNAEAIVSESGEATAAPAEANGSVSLPLVSSWGSLLPPEVESADLVLPPEAEPEVIHPRPTNYFGGLSISHDRLQRCVDGLFLGLCGVTLVSLVVPARQLAPTTPPPAAVPTPVNQPMGESQRAFADYLQRSLATIEQQAANPAPTANSLPPLAMPGTPVASSIPLPPVAVPANPEMGTIGMVTPAENGTQTATVSASKLYIPVYQDAATPPVASSPVAVPLPGPAPSVATAPIPMPPSTPVSTEAGSPPQTLVGLLEMGDRSAALFEINGVTQRYGIGESVGSSGWTLVEVAKNQVVLRRNGETRSIFMGQKF